MGTHPIFESDFDCLTDCVINDIKMPGAETEKKTETPVVEEKTPVEQMKEKVAEEAKNGDKKTEDKPVAAKEGDADADSSDEKKEEEKSDEKKTEEAKDDEEKEDEETGTKRKAEDKDE